MNKKQRVSFSERRLILRRIIVYSAAFFVLGILQCSFFSRLSPFGATPDIVLGGICAVCMLDGKRAAAVCAVSAGFFVDALGALPPSFSPLFYLLCVVSIGAITDKMMQSFVSFCVCLLGALLLGAAYTYFCTALAGGALISILAIWRTLVSGALGTFIFSLPTYPLIKLCGTALKDFK